MFLAGSAEGAAGETFMSQCVMHMQTRLRFSFEVAKVLKIFHEKKIAALWKEMLSIFNISTYKYAIFSKILSIECTTCFTPSFWHF